MSRNSDQMSLSSLSSGDNNILEQGPQGFPHPGGMQYPYPPGMPPPQGGWYPPAPGYPPHMQQGYYPSGPYGYPGGGPGPPGGPYPGGPGDWGPGMSHWNGDVNPYDAYNMDMAGQSFQKPGPKSVRPVMK